MKAVQHHGAGSAGSPGRPGSTLTFEEIYGAYAEPILNLTYRMTLNGEAARDLTQDIFLKVYENLGDFHARSGVYTWIYRIAVNHVLNHLKREKRIVRLEMLRESAVIAVRRDGSPGDPVGDPGPVPADLGMERAERARIVWTAVCSLPAKYRVPIVLYQYEEMSYKDIAEIMDMSMSAVETRIHRARRRLVKILGPVVDHL